MISANVNRDLGELYHDLGEFNQAVVLMLLGALLLLPPLFMDLSRRQGRQPVLCPRRRDETFDTISIFESLAQVCNLIMISAISIIISANLHRPCECPIASNDVALPPRLANVGPGA